MTKKIGPKLAQKLDALISNAAWTYARKLPFVDIDDLKQDGWVSVIRALESYDPSHGPPTPYLWRSVVYGMHRGINRLRPPTSGHGHRPAESMKGQKRVPVPEAGYGTGSTASFWVDANPLPDALLADAEITAAVVLRLQKLGASPEVVAVLQGNAERADLSADKTKEYNRVKWAAQKDRRLGAILHGNA